MNLPAGVVVVFGREFLELDPDPAVAARLRDGIGRTRSQDAAGAQETFREAFQASGGRSLSALFDLFQLGNLTGDHRLYVLSTFEWGFARFKEGRDDLALAALSGSWANDFSLLKGMLSGERQLLAGTVRAYEQIALRHAGGAPRRASGPFRPGGRPLRIAHVVPQMVDRFHSPTKLAISFLKNHRREGLETFLYVSEAFAVQRPDYPLATYSPSTLERAPETLRRIASLSIPVHVQPPRSSYLEQARELAARIAADGIDVLAYHSSMACAVDCLVAGWRPAPVQVCLNIGNMPMQVAGVDAVIYFMESTMSQDAPSLRERGIRSIFMPSGVEVDEQVERVPTRTELGIPEGAFVFAIAGNHLESRIGPVFLDALRRILIACPEAHWAVIGRGAFSSQREFLVRHGLGARTTFLGFRPDAPAILRAVDAYLNEFPEGGGMSVLEAMAAGRAAVTMRYSDDHLCSAGAEYVGPDAIPGPDVDAYVDLAVRVVRDEPFRSELGARLRRRYEEVFSARKMTRAFEDLFLELATEERA